MGYYTTFRLQTINNESHEDLTYKMQTELININPGYFDKDTVEDLMEGWMESKWYRWEEDVRELSLKFLNTLFVLEGNGEESEDMWVAYFKNGKMQFEKAQIVYDKFDESKLK